ncbi:MAG: CapA family protein [Polyangiales bacterium]
MELFLCGDVMTGRGVDQILRHPSAPELIESYIQDARDYVSLAETESGPIPRGVNAEYPWGDALPALAHADARIVNLETSITRSDDVWLDKAVNYRMHPANVDCLTAARIDICALANNHVLDYGRSGLIDTLDVLDRVGIARAGAGRDLEEAQKPATIALPSGGRVSVIAVGDTSSGIPREWAAGKGTSGVELLPDVDDATADALAVRIASRKKAGDIVIVSIHWGGNWGYMVPPSHRHFAHRLVDAGADVVHGHSSHHPRPFEVYRERLVLHGCGDFLNDYEGIRGYESFRSDLVVGYAVRIDGSTGALADLRLVPFRLRKLRLECASATDAAWLADTLERVSSAYGTHVVVRDGVLRLR